MLQRVKYPQHTELVFLDGEPRHLPNVALLLNSLEALPPPPLCYLVDLFLILPLSRLPFA